MKLFLSRILLAFLSGYGLTACSDAAPPATAIRIRWATAPQTLDPLLVSTPPELEAINLLHCSLLLGDPDNQQVVPWLAEQLPAISRRDSLTLLTYRLRPEATWDNGQPVLARDVAFTLRVLNCPGLPTEFARAQYGFVSDIELDATDPRRFTLVCRSASAGVVLSSGDYSILPEYALDAAGSLRAVPLPLLRTDTAAALRQYPALRTFAARYRQAQLARHPQRLPGCGPYTVTAWEQNRYLRLKRKASWWARKLQQPPWWLQAHAAQLDYQIIPDHATALLALRRGNLDLYPMPSARAFQQLKHSADSARLAFYTADSYDLTVAGFNTSSALLRDAATRRALSYLFDIPALLHATQQGLAYRSNSLVNPHDQRAYADSLPALSFAPAVARRLLQQAGWQLRADNSWWRGATGPLALRFSYKSGATDHETIGLQFQAAAAALHIPVSLHPAEAGLLQQQLAAGQAEVFARTMSGNPFFYNFAPILHSRGEGLYNFYHFQHPTADQLIDAIATEPSLQRQAQLLKRFQRLLRQEVPLVVLYFTRNRLVASRRLQPVQTLSTRPGYKVQSLQLRPSTL